MSVCKTRQRKANHPLGRCYPVLNHASLTAWFKSACTRVPRRCYEKAWVGLTRQDLFPSSSQGLCGGLERKRHKHLPLPGLRRKSSLPYLREIKNLGIDGAVSIELEYSPEPAQIVEWVREAYEKTDALMRQAGLRG